MGKMPKDVRDRISKAKVAQGGINIRHGEYILMFMRSSYDKMNSGQCHINEFVVWEAKKNVVFEGEKEINVEPNPVFSTCSYVINYDGKGKLSADGNSKSIVLGLLGKREGEVGDDQLSEMLGELTDDAQLIKGTLIKCITYPKEVRSRPGHYITGLNWECIDLPGQGVNSSEQCQARLAQYAKKQEQQAA